MWKAGKDGSGKLLYGLAWEDEQVPEEEKGSNCSSI